MDKICAGSGDTAYGVHGRARLCQRRGAARYSVYMLYWYSDYLLYWYQSTNTDALLRSCVRMADAVVPGCIAIHRRAPRRYYADVVGAASC